MLSPLFSSKRDKEVIKLVRKGQATDDELYEAQFGEWPLRGLDKTEHCDDVIHIKSLRKDKKLSKFSYLFHLGHVHREKEDEQTIYLNNVLLSPAGPLLGFFATRMAYARIHDVIELLTGVRAPFALPELLILAGVSSYRYALASSMVKLFAPSVADIVGEEQIHLKQVYDQRQAVLTNAFQGAAQDWLSNQSEWKKATTNLMQVIDTVLTWMPQQYYAGDAELQARLHNVIVRGYEAWGQIPKNRDELYAALLDMGIKAPNIVKDYYAQDQQAYLTETFNKHVSWQHGLLCPPNAEMNLGLSSFRDGAILKTGDVLEMYWKDCLPYLYADLLTKYGDPNALEKFGFSEETDLYGIPIPLEEPMHS